MSVECKPLDWLFYYSAGLSLSLDHQQLLCNVLSVLQSLCDIESGLLIERYRVINISPTTSGAEPFFRLMIYYIILSYLAT